MFVSMISWKKENKESEKLAGSWPMLIDFWKILLYTSYTSLVKLLMSQRSQGNMKTKKFIESNMFWR